MKIHAEKPKNISRTLDSSQKSRNNTGLPDKLKSGIENLSGVCMNDVNVHYNSDKPAQLHAHAYASGPEIHVAPGQERHLPHEAWHVVQQKQGRVRPTAQMKNVAVNNDKNLENEATSMGEKALQMMPVVQLAWNATNNTKLTKGSINDFVDEIDEEINAITVIPPSPARMRQGRLIRIDMQGPVQRGDEIWANIQIQKNGQRVGNSSIAGVICPFDLPIEEVKNGLHEAMEQRDVLEWSNDTEEEDGWEAKERAKEKAEAEELAEWAADETEDAPQIAFSNKEWKSFMKYN